MSDYIPPEIITRILLCLPVKSLLKFRSVCKTWYEEIGSRHFINKHMKERKTNQYRRKLVLSRYYCLNSGDEQFSLRFESNFEEFSVIRCPMKAKVYCRVVGVCNGLVCLSDDLFGPIDYIIIWNPAIQRFLELPTPSVAVGPAMVVHGFGFDARTDEFKVVRLAYLQKSGNIWYEDIPKVEVYALSSGSWKTIEHGVPSCNVVDTMWSQVFLNGSVHWTGFRSDGKSLENVVLSFNMADDKFEIFEFPESHAKRVPLQFSIGLCGGLLALFVYDNPVDCSKFSVCVMKEYGVGKSWITTYRVDMKISRILGFRNDGEIILGTKENTLMSYKPICNQTKYLGISGYWDSLYTAAYEESMVLFNRFTGDLASQPKSYESPADSDEEDVLDEDYINRSVGRNYAFAANSVPGITVSLLS